MAHFESAETALLFVTFVLVVAWATGVSFTDVGLAKGAYLLVKAPFEIGGIVKSLLPGGFGDSVVFLGFTLGVFPFLKGTLGEGLYGFVIVATIAAIVTGGFF